MNAVRLAVGWWPSETQGHFERRALKHPAWMPAGASRDERRIVLDRAAWIGGLGLPGGCRDMLRVSEAYGGCVDEDGAAIAVRSMGGLRSVEQRVKDRLVHTRGETWQTKASI